MIVLENFDRTLTGMGGDDLIAVFFEINLFALGDQYLVVDDEKRLPMSLYHCNLLTPLSRIGQILLLRIRRAANHLNCPYILIFHVNAIAATEAMNSQNLKDRSFSSGGFISWTGAFKKIVPDYSHDPSSHIGHMNKNTTASGPHQKNSIPERGE